MAHGIKHPVSGSYSESYSDNQGQHVYFYSVVAFLGNTATLFIFYYSNSKSSGPRYIFRAISCKYAAAVFGVIPVNHIMASVLDATVNLIGPSEP